MTKKTEAYEYWEKTKDLIDQCIDIMVNYRQSGHPGGSRSKVHILLPTLLGGVMRWDIRDPGKPFADRFVLGAGHTVPLIYATLAVLNEAVRAEGERTGDPRFNFATSREQTLFWEDLVGFRRRGGLSGHAEREGKTLFLGFNTGPSGHGTPAAAGIALALKRAGARDVKVFLLEGEGGLTPGSTHETANSAWGLALDNLHLLLDWNDFGIDGHPYSDVVSGTPEVWFSSHGWRVSGTDKLEDWGAIHGALKSLVDGENPNKAPGVCWVKTRKGRGYYKYDNASHGAPHAKNSELFWKTKQDFAEKYGASFVNAGGEAPSDEKELREEFRANLEAVIRVLRDDSELVSYLANRLVELGESVPEKIDGFRLAEGSPYSDKRLLDFASYPKELFAAPGEKAANRAALAKWGAWVNSFGARNYGRPVFLASSADLSGSTNISGFAESFGDFPGYGWYERTGTEEGVLLPQAITEFSNSGISAGIASTNFALDPQSNFDGFWAITSTYGSFSYLLYGMMRLYSQMAQDSQFRMGKIVWVAGHSGPETADDSRTHFGIFSPGVTQLFPRGSVVNIHPWEHNEVPVLLGAALATDAAIVALHLTRPPVEIPDRAALSMPDHSAAARGAYVVRDRDPKRSLDGTFFVQGTSVMAELVKALGRIDASGWNVKIVCVTSTELFERQTDDYRASVLTEADKANSTVMTTQSRKLMADWMFNPSAAEYAVCGDFDDRWRTGGELPEILDEAHLTADHIFGAMERFVLERKKRLSALREQLDATE